MEVEVIIMIIFGIIGLLALVAAVAAIILIEVKYTDKHPWWVQVMLWGGFIVFLLCVILIAFMGISLKLKKNSRKKKQVRYKDDPFEYDKPREDVRTKRIDDDPFEYAKPREVPTRTVINGNVIEKVAPNGDVVEVLLPNGDIYRNGNIIKKTTPNGIPNGNLTPNERIRRIRYTNE